MTNIKLKGLYPASILPFTGDDKVNFDGLKKNLQYLIDSGCSGVCVNGSTGEAINLDREERKAVIKTAREYCPKDFLVIAGTGAPTTKVAVQQTIDAKEAGADVALVITPFNCIPNKAGLIKHYKAVAETGIPILLYNLPEHTGCEIDLETLSVLSGIDNIIGMKESSGDLSYYTKAIQVTPDDFSVLCGADDKVFLALCLGAEAHILALGNLAPAKITEMMDAVDKGDLVTAQKIHFSLLGLGEAILAAENFPAPIKEAARILGLVSSDPRMPTIAVDEEESKFIRKALENAGLI